MKRLIILLVIFYCDNLFGQISDFRNYQEKINIAEMNLIKGKKDEALNSYYEILTTSKGNFCKDIYNAMLLSKELSKTDTFFLFLNLIKTKGLNNIYMNRLEEFQTYHSNRKWKQFEAENNNSNINKELRNNIDSLHIRDQLFRKKEGSYKVYGDTIHKIDSINLYYIYSLLYANNFPGEDEIGVSSITGNQGYDIVFHHYTQKTSLVENKRMPKITPILVNLVLQGKVMPNKCSHWLEMQNGEFKAGVFGISNFSINGIKTNYYREKYSYERKLILDEYRKWMCLESLEDYLENSYLHLIIHPQNIDLI
ncbi:MAG: hypothetical protein IPO21_11060 [Bacteroidales bacterium]|nr:hypothetical protein [Bacteroidales bacterium]